MARCDICGSKECCGASRGPDIEKLELQRDQLLAALKEIAAWNSHGVQFSVKYGSSGERDLYRSVARRAIAAVEEGNQS